VRSITALYAAPAREKGVQFPPRPFKKLYKLILLLIFMALNLLEDNEKLVKKFGANLISELKEVPDFYTFEKGLVYSHRDFEKFFSAVKKGEKCAIVSGFNASGTIHLGHKPVFDTNLFFQKEYGIPVFIPISDDESYVSGKVKDQEQALEYAFQLAKELLAYGFDPKNTFFMIDQIYTNIYNLAFKLSKRITMSEIKSSYGYNNENNIGIHFYPAVQSAHILFPQEFGIKNVLVPIGPDEDAHIRIGRDVAARMNYKKPAVLHLKFLPGIDGEKMSKSKNNHISLKEDEKTIRKKIARAFSGGQKGIEDHRKLGGNPEIDIACQYLYKLFLDKKQGEKLFEDYRKGKLLSGEVKKKLAEEIINLTKTFQKNLKEISEEKVQKCILQNNKSL
jgi:tryptophanyl-tRNA synthetase